MWESDEEEVSQNVINKRERAAAAAASKAAKAEKSILEDAVDFLKSDEEEARTNVFNKVRPNAKDDNDAAKAADDIHGALINNNKDAPHKDKDDNGVPAKAADDIHGVLNNGNSNTLDKDKDNNAVPMVSLYRHCLHLSLCSSLS